MDSEYKPPILASIFRFFGWINVIAAVVILVIGLAGSGGGDSAIGAAFLACLAGLASALVFFGLSQVIDYIGRIAFNSTALLAVVQQHSQASGSRAKETNASTKSLLDALKRTLPAANQPAPAKRVPKQPVREAEKFYYSDAEGQPIGPVELSDLEALADDNVIGPETLICRAGQTDWCPLESLTSLAVRC